MNQSKHNDVLDAIAAITHDPQGGHAPSCREIARRLNRKPQSIHRSLCRLRQRGLVTWSKVGPVIAIEVVR